MTMFNLRDYQLEAIEATEAAWSEGIERPVVVLSTGAGKTVVFAALIERHIKRLRKEGKRVLVLAHREELLEQAEAKIKATIPDVWTAIVKGARGVKTSQLSEVVIASVQTLARRVEAGNPGVDRIGMVIVDECHLYAAPSYRRVIEHYAPAPTVGFTATLTRMDGGLPDVWQSVAYQKKIHWFIKQGHLVPPVARSIEVPGLNLSTVRITAGDLNIKGVADALEEAHAFRLMAEQWHMQAADRPTIAFLPNVATCEQMAEAVRALGATAEVITGKTSSTERKAAYARFASRETAMLVSAMVLTTGFDAPHTSCVLIGRPTKNPGLYIQMVGRGLRPDAASGKQDCLVLDLAGASLTHNLAGVNDLESDCESPVCDCNCLSCGCGVTCKCVKRQCGCRCIEQHEKGPKDCGCAGSEECGCLCQGEGVTEETGEPSCICHLNPACGCRQGRAAPEAKDVEAAVLTTLREVDILGTEIKRSGYTWLTTHAGIQFVQHSQDGALFLLPAPEGGFYQGVVTDMTKPRERKVERLDSGALPAAEALAALEKHAEDNDYTYSNKRAAWRRTPASDAQLNQLKRMRIMPPEGKELAQLRKGEASDLLSISKVSGVLDRKFGKYVTAGG